MAMCCIGGVCVPYTAIAPLIVLGIKWILDKLVSLGVIPSSWVEKANAFLLMMGGQRQPSSSHTKKNSNSSSKYNKSNRQESSSLSSSCTCPTTSSSRSSSNVGGGGEGEEGNSNNDNSNNKHTQVVVREVDSEEDWDKLMELSHSTPLVVKFTADWCQPCKAIHPLFCQLAAQLLLQKEEDENNQKPTLFATVNVDDLDEVAAVHRIAILPTFAVFEQGKLVRRYTGSNEAQLTDFILQGGKE